MPSLPPVRPAIAPNRLGMRLVQSPRRIILSARTIRRVEASRTPKAISATSGALASAPCVTMMLRLRAAARSIRS